MKYFIAIAALSVASPVMAANYTQHDVHEHGVGKLNLAMSGGQLAMELTAPGADIVGFEDLASSDEDKQAVADALEQLHAPLELVIPTVDAQCQLVTAEAHIDGGEQHTEFHAEYVLECANPMALNDFSFPYFQLFPNALELEVQIVNDNGARAFEVERAQPQLEF